MNDALHRVIGIDLGTTYSAVAAFNDEDLTPEILIDTAAEGAGAATPSVVLRDPKSGQAVVGHAAKDAMASASDDAEIIIEIKREMGAEFDARLLDQYRAGAEFSVGDPVRVRFGAEWLRPQEVSALVLLKMKSIAEDGLGGELRDAVVTVPAYFTERQKRATEEAALLAGLYPRQLIPEPTAAAICYGVDRADSGRHVYLVYDMGGGTFDVSIIETHETSIEVIATAGDYRLGGGDIDAAIVDWLTAGLGLSEKPAVGRLALRAIAEKAKRALSYADVVPVVVPGHPALDLTRARFEELIAGLLARSIAEVEKALQFAREKGVERADIDAILLVGGSTKVPRVKRALLEHFDRQESFVRSDGNPDTLVARGAALQARRFAPSENFDLAVRPAADQTTDEEDELQVTLITEHTLGVSTITGEFFRLLDVGSKIPATRTRSLWNPHMATGVVIGVYQGEQPFYADNELIGEIVIDEIEPLPEFTHEFQITFTLTIDGLLQVDVYHVNTEKRYEGSYDHRTHIGRVSELAERRARLLEIAAVDRSSAPGPISALPAPDELPDIGLPS